MQGPLPDWQLTRHHSQRIFNQLEQKGPHNPKRVATNEREGEGKRGRERVELIAFAYVSFILCAGRRCSRGLFSLRELKLKLEAVPVSDRITHSRACCLECVSAAERCWHWEA